MQNGKLISGLNEALSRELTTVIRYVVEGSLIRGIENQPLRAFYQEEIPSEIGHAQYLADKIVILGGTPEVKLDLKRPATQVGQMIEGDLAAEESDVAHYKKLARLAEESGDIELKLKMEAQAADESRHAEALRRMQA